MFFLAIFAKSSIINFLTLYSMFFNVLTPDIVYVFARADQRSATWIRQI